MKRINVFLGNYGSGKTEISLNMAINLKKSSKKVTLYDMDIVNPYFRSSDHKEMLKNLGIDVISPTFANTAVDLPTLSPMVYSIINNSDTCIIDCGGDPAGATAMGFLSKKLNTLIDDMDVFFVMNTYRPLQSDAKSVIEMIDSIEHVSNLKVTKLIINSNLSVETDYTSLEQGLIIGKQVAKAKNIDIAFICGTNKTINDYKANNENNDIDFFNIEIFTRPEWLNNN